MCHYNCKQYVSMVRLNQIVVYTYRRNVFYRLQKRPYPIQISQSIKFNDFDLDQSNSRIILGCPFSRPKVEQNFGQPKPWKLTTQNNSRVWLVKIKIIECNWLVHLYWVWSFFQSIKMHKKTFRILTRFGLTLVISLVALLVESRSVKGQRLLLSIHVTFLHNNGIDHTFNTHITWCTFGIQIYDCLSTISALSVGYPRYWHMQTNFYPIVKF